VLKRTSSPLSSHAAAANAPLPAVDAGAQPDQLRALIF